MPSFIPTQPNEIPLQTTLACMLYLTRSCYSHVCIVKENLDVVLYRRSSLVMFIVHMVFIYMEYIMVISLLFPNAW